MNLGSNHINIYDARRYIKSWLASQGLTLSGAISLKTLIRKSVWRIKDEFKTSDSNIDNYEKNTYKRFGFKFDTPDELSVFIVTNSLVDDICAGKYNKLLLRIVPVWDDSHNNMSQYIDIQIDEEAEQPEKLRRQEIHKTQHRRNLQEELALQERRINPPSEMGPSKDNKDINQQDLRNRFFGNKAKVVSQKQPPATTVKQTPSHTPTISNDNDIRSKFFDSTKTNLRVKPTSSMPLVLKNNNNPAKKSLGADKGVRAKQSIPFSPHTKIKKPAPIPRHVVTTNIKPNTKFDVKSNTPDRKPEVKAKPKINPVKQSDSKLTDNMTDSKTLPYKIRTKGPNRKPVTRLKR